MLKLSIPIYQSLYFDANWVRLQISSIQAGALGEKDCLLSAKSEPSQLVMVVEQAILS